MYESDRISMVTNQLEKRGINDKRVLAAMEKIQRHLFVRDEDRIHAYEDRPLGIGLGQTISQPYIVALMTQTLSLRGEEKVLEIGTGSGYQTVILTELSKEVYTIERKEELSLRTKKLFDTLNIGNIHTRIGDGTLGWIEAAPFDRIIVTAASPHIPQSLFDQLVVDGRMVIPVGGRYAQNLNLVIKKAGEKMQVIHRGGCVFVPLVGENGWKNG